MSKFVKPDHRQIASARVVAAKQISPNFIRVTIAGDVPVGFGSVLGGLDKPHDGTVAVSETRLKGATDHAVLHCTHTSLLWSPKVAEYVQRFLRDGRFPA